MPLFQPAPWRDRLHPTTFAWMVTGLLTSGWIALDEWAPGVAGRATYAQSTVRRFRRWLSNPRIDALRLYAALLRQALGGCPDQRWVVALATTVWWNTFCVVQVALVWRGRAVPVAWKMLRHPSAGVAFRGVLGFAAWLLSGQEGFLDHQSGDFQGESSRLRDPEALQRLCLVMAAATLTLTCQGAAVVAAGRRREVDPHGFRGFSYARIGWHWIRRALSRGGMLIRTLALPTARDPEPARASRGQLDRSRWMADIPYRYLFLFAVPSMT